MSRIRIAAAIMALTIVAGSLASTSPARPSSARSKATDVTVLFDRALEIVHSKPDFRNAVVLEADGTPYGNRVVKRASGITRWRFVFVNSGNSGFPSVTLNYSRSSGFGKPVGHREPFLEDVEIKRAPKMTLARAVSLLRDAGYGKPFFNVTLRSPLGPELVPPLYIFALKGSGFVGVNTKTEKVAPLS